MLGKSFSFIAATAPVLISFTAQAAEQNPATCLQTAVVTVELTECGEAIYLAAKNRMTEAYREVESHANGAIQKQQLQASQDAWEAYRRAYCNFASAGTGSLESLTFSQCSAALADDRTKELNSWPPLRHAGSRF